MKPATFWRKVTGVKIAPTRTILSLASALTLLCGGDRDEVAQQKLQGATRGHYPRIIHADVPFYPPVAWSAHFGGTVDIEVVVEEGKVIHANVKRGKVEGATGRVSTGNAALLDYLSLPSLENVRTWRFEPERRTTFVVTYSYRIQGSRDSVAGEPNRAA